MTRAWHPQALHQAFRPPSVHLSSLDLESSFNEYRLPCTAVTIGFIRRAMGARDIVYDE